MSAVLSSEKLDVEVTKPTKPEFFDPGTLSWEPWVMEGTYYKLLAVDQKSGGFTLLLKVDPGVTAPIHGHSGAVEGYITKGWMAYGEDSRGNTGYYITEAGGVRHEPTAPDGVEIFAILHGPLVGYDPDGSVSSIVDAKFMYEMATEAGQADHIDAHFEE